MPTTRASHLQPKICRRIDSGGNKYEPRPVSAGGVPRPAGLRVQPAAGVWAVWTAAAVSIWHVSSAAAAGVYKHGRACTTISCRGHGASSAAPVPADASARDVSGLCTTRGLPAALRARATAVPAAARDARAAATAASTTSESTSSCTILRRRSGASSPTDFKCAGVPSAAATAACRSSTSSR